MLSECKTENCKLGSEHGIGMSRLRPVLVFCGCRVLHWAVLVASQRICENGTLPELLLEMVWWQVAMICSREGRCQSLPVLPRSTSPQLSRCAVQRLQHFQVRQIQLSTAFLARYCLLLCR